MHVQPFVPARIVRMFVPSIATRVASFETSSGAADIALFIRSSSVAGGVTGPTAGGVASAAGAGLGSSLVGADGWVHAVRKDAINRGTTRLSISLSSFSIWKTL